jgi:hypothetical protein
MSHVINTYDEDLKGSIQSLWSEAIKARESTLSSLDDTAAKFLAVGEVLDKAKQSHSQDLFLFLDEIMSPNEIQQTLSLRKHQLRRGGKLDKVQLQKMGLLEQQELSITHQHTAAKPSVISTFAKLSSKMVKAIEARPVESMSQSEREQTLTVIKPIIEIYNQLNK